MKGEMEVFDRIPSVKPRGWRAWMGKIIVDKGIVFLPFPGSQMDAILRCGYDGTDVIHYSGHIFCPSDWLIQEFPEMAEGIRKVVAEVLPMGRHVALANGPEGGAG